MGVVCVCVSYRVHDGSQYDLVGTALQDDLNVSLQKTRLREELGLRRKGLRRLCSICFPFERWTLERRKHVNIQTRTHIVMDDESLLHGLNTTCHAGELPIGAEWQTVSESTECVSE